MHALFETEVQHRCFLIVLNTCDTGEVTLLVVGLHLVHNRCRQILHGRLRVARHELLSVHLHLTHLLTVDGHRTVVAHLSTWQFLHQFLHHGALWRTIGCSIIDSRVLYDCHAHSLSRNGRILQHDGIRAYHHLSEIHIGRILQRHIFLFPLITHAGEPHHVASVLFHFQHKRPVVTRQSPRHESRILFRKQLNSNLRHRFFCVAVHHIS